MERRIVEKGKCEECGKDAEYYDICFKCCDHSDIEEDERCCLICGRDMTDDLAGRAYDAYKDRMKYGDD